MGASKWNKLYKKQVEINGELAKELMVTRNRLQVMIALVCFQNNGKYTMDKEKLNAILGFKTLEDHDEDGTIHFRIVRAEEKKAN